MNHFGALVDEIAAEIDARELRKSRPLIEPLAQLVRSRVTPPSIGALTSELDAMLKALPPLPPLPTPAPTAADVRAAIARTRQTLGAAVAAGKLTALQTARCEARLHAIGDAVLGR